MINLLQPNPLFCILPVKRLLCPLLFSLIISVLGGGVAHAATEEICLPESFYPLQVTREVGAPLHSKLQDWLDRAVNGEGSIKTSQHPRVAEWRREIKKIPINRSRRSLEKINRLTNAHVRYIEDYQLHKKTDFWNTPHDTLVQGGDCEDIALLKAAALRYRGVPPENLHLLVGYTIFKGRKIAHAVLAVKVGKSRYILDSLHDRVIPYKKASIEPAYAINPKSAVLFPTDQARCKIKRGTRN